MDDLNKIDKPRVERLKGVEAALNRAAQRAREVAARTGTPLVIYVNGEIKKIMIRPEDLNKPGSTNTPTK